MCLETLVPWPRPSRRKGDVYKRQPFIQAIETAKARPTVAAWSEMDNELTNAMTAVVNGEKTAQEAMDELAVVFDELLKP